MVYYQSVLGVVQGMRLCGHETGASWEESWHEIYAGKRTQSAWSAKKSLEKLQQENQGLQSFAFLS